MGNITFFFFKVQVFTHHDPMTQKSLTSVHQSLKNDARLSSASDFKKTHLEFPGALSTKGN